MPSFNPFTSVTGRHAFTLFDIRLESDFIVFRGNEHESSGQMLQGVVAVCVPGPTKIEDIHLRLTGTQHLSWIDSKITPTGISNSKVDKSTVIYQHRWPSFMGTPGKSMILEKGNYEFPFEVLLPGDTAESVEGMSEGSIVYRLKATIARGKLAYDMHAYKHIRVVRTLESSALEFLHAMSVENIWPNKVEYSIIVPQKAIVFGSAVPLETRFSPLLKGLEIGDITIKLLEIHEIFLQGNHGHHLKEHKKEREVASWTLSVTREEHWHDMIEDTGQEGWMLNTQLDLPRKLGKCMQDANVHGIKIRHKLKMVVSLKNPDGHISELRATLPITIFISPNIPLDEEGNLRGPAQQASADPGQANSIAPPGYGEHVLDQLYDEVEIAGLQTPGVQSGVSSPFYGQSRSGSSENLAAMLNSNSIPVPPAALSSRLEGVSQSVGGNSLHSNTSISGSGFNTPSAQHVHGIESASTSPAQSAPLSRHNSGEEGSGQATPEHLDYPEMSVLCKVPSYATAIKTTRVTPLAVSERVRLPDYQTVISAPTTPTAASASLADPLTLILEASNEDHHDASAQGPQRPASLPRRQTSPLTMLGHHLSHGDADERQRLHLLRARERVA